MFGCSMYILRDIRLWTKLWPWNWGTCEMWSLKVIESCTIRSADSQNPTLEPNITSIGKPVAKLWPILAVSCHLGFYRTANSAIRSADLKNPSLEAYMEWIVCEVFAFKLYCDLETAVQGHSRSSKAALFDETHTTLYSSSVVTKPLLLFPRCSCILVENRYPPCIWCPRCLRFTQRSLVTKN